MWIISAILAGFFMAVMDATENENVGESIFKNLNPKFWHKRESWKYAKKVFGYRFDAWHISKSFMIASFLSIPVFYWHFPWFRLDEFWGDLAIFLLQGGFIVGGAFVSFYHTVFGVKDNSTFKNE